MKISRIFSNVVLVTAIVAWAVCLFGVIYSNLFVSDELPTERSIMSPRTFTSIYLVMVGWLISCAAFVASIVAIIFSVRNKAIYSAAILSSIYFLPLSILFLWNMQ